MQIRFYSYAYNGNADSVQVGKCGQRTKQYQNAKTIWN
jgi:hypothetical protein